MKKDEFLRRLDSRKLIAAIKEERYIEKAINKNLSGVFLLTGNIGVIKKYVDFFRANDMFTFVHMEKIGGISFDKEGLEFVANYVKPDGIITTKNSLIKIAKKLNMLTIQRCFMIDTDALKKAIEISKETQPDFVELMPALMPDVIREFTGNTSEPVISGGLIKTSEQMMNALLNGAIAVSTGTPRLWNVDASKMYKEVSKWREQNQLQTLVMQ
ncbi:MULTISPECIES: glycerol-3-phosphate responsive antiterminator [Thermoanaerobacterium]|uniref:Glycerol-3-phosphate responsive antiterminator GlpP n=2 Tax=Thermoanaerobacterium TaxID=28895 RepID=W9EA83_9THEO|nr:MULTISPECIES: glycerol-3-phosphate responsive antiterminator [Thermoanaerobacterium]AFK87095.1 glycerol-3-phosphate responsive antiterminator, GlpP [Thermoanaerobacterium saccharolyticum JW/SL-YS485]ETO38877.1 glycerol-3-phosphate responsive antiterminator GlpP [Thermoanaerobacterium aotearoense SCUT27]